MTVRAAVSLAALAAALAACGAGDGADEARHVRSALVELRDAYVRGDVAAMCARLTAPARRQAGQVAHGSVDGCPSDLLEALSVADARRGLQRGEALVVERVRIDDSRAWAAVAVDGRRVEVPLAMEDGRWRVDSFFGTQPREAERIAARLPAASFPDVSGRPARPVVDGEPCLDVLEADGQDVVGDCELVTFGASVTLEVLTPFGYFHFEDCKVRYRAWVDSRGRAWTHAFGVNADANNGCSDVSACTADGEKTMPWKGRLTTTADGRVLHTMRTCLRTCIGYYAGNLTIELDQTAQGWHAEAVGAEVGASGLRLDGDLAVEPGFDVARTARRS